MLRMEEADLFKVFETDQFLKDLEKINETDKIKIYNKVLDRVYPQLKDNPYFGKNIKKLKAYKPYTWRYRIGNFILFYEICDKEKIINITAIEIRGGSYK